MREAYLEKTEACLESKEPTLEEMRQSMRRSLRKRPQWKLLEH
jgi:hypothetical protein